MQNWYVANPGPIGPTYWRRTLPLRHLARSLWDQGVAISYGPKMIGRRHYDAIFCSRNLPDPRLLDSLIERQERGSVIVWDMDDDLLHLPPLHDPTRELRRRRIEESALIRACLEMADLITVSTEPLAQACGHPGKTNVCPNLIDLDDYPIVVDPEPRDVVLYSGSPSHLGDVELIRDLYHETCREYRWVFYGVRPAWLDRYGVYVPWGTVRDYPRVCRLFRPLACLAPLEGSSFNDCKSPIKVWESATFGACVLASNTGPYRGHPAALVPEGEPFTREHLDRAIARHRRPSVDVARANSWQQGTGSSAWARMFAAVS